jgi:hypothetical protein
MADDRFVNFDTGMPQPLGSTLLGGLIVVAAPTNANAAAAGVAVGQLYRDNADPAKLYVRTV